MTWALAIKRQLGDTWHLAGHERRIVARCDHRIRLDLTSRTENPDGFLCRRCIRIEALKTAEHTK